ncbi:zinc knuckle CX2CX4HX4C containing protein [Tanacetum coccineum]
MVFCCWVLFVVISYGSSGVVWFIVLVQVAFSFHGLIMKKRFLTATWRGSGKGVKEKKKCLFDDRVKIIDSFNKGIGSSSTINVNMEPIPVTSVPIYLDNMVCKPNVACVGLADIPNVASSSTIIASTPEPVSFATLSKCDASRKSINFLTLLAPASNGADVTISKESVRDVGERFSNIAYGFFIGKCVAYPDGMHAMLENDPLFIHNILLILKKWTPNVNLLKEDVCNVPLWVNFHDVPITAFCEDGLSSIATKLGTLLLFESYNLLCTRNHEDVLKNLKIPRPAVRGVRVGSKLGFKPTKQVYQPVFKKNGASASGKKKQAGVTSQEVSNSNPFHALNTIENDNDLGTSGGNSKFPEKGANFNVVSSTHGTSSETFGSPTTTPLVEKINDLERQMLDGETCAYG